MAAGDSFEGFEGFISDTWNADEALSKLHMEYALEGIGKNFDVAKRLLEENLPLAVMAMCHLATRSKIEGIRLNASKYVIDRTMGPAEKVEARDHRSAWEEIYDQVLTEATNELRANSE